MTKRACLLLLCLAVSASALAAGLRVDDAWIRLLPGEVPAGGYFTVHNDTDAPVRLEAARCSAFGHVMMHRTVVESGRARMEGVDAVGVPAHGTLRFAPGGYHLMLMQRARPLAVGDEVPVVLEFSGGRSVTVAFQVRGPAGK